MDELYLENIDEFVNDQDRIVTYKWLSHTLGVHVNQAKQMLYDYVEKKRKENSASQLHVTYLVSGKLIQNGAPCHKVAVVKEDQLEALKGSLALTVSVHIYSVQKTSLKDSGPLYIADYDAVKSNLSNCSKFSAIRCCKAVPRTLDEVSQLKKQTKTTAKTANEASAACAATVNGYTPPSTKQVTQQPKGILAMFAAKTSPKTQEQNKDVKAETKEDAVAVSTVSSSKPVSKSNAMSNFFGKAAKSKSKAAVLPTDEPLKEGNVEVHLVASKPAVSTEGEKEKKSLVEDATKTTKNLETDKQKTDDRSSKTKRREALDSEEEIDDKQRKKRRRIKKPQSDSSEDEAIPDSPPVSPNIRDVKAPSASPEKPVKEETRPVTPPAEHIHVTAGVKRRKRRRVLKSKTFVDDEGCIVTEKVYESESYSEDEDPFVVSKQLPKQGVAQKAPPAPTKKEAKETSKKGAATGKGVKQASIMGFFQKK
ncbi:DNA polymerase delta subunit 3 [Protopterus annectens]|uniref:DNA polymerase delta subunit 3 n=1 Tax=Protopterus annectens TaxID=7888 RepID=UPI001CF96B0A|nr:DNA polymerase delta subunit 3 [Protopterus annectens]